MTTTAQAMVIGGGVAGGALAAQLARAGRHVVLIERKAGPHDKVCGEFISADGIRYLRILGIDLAALGAAPISALNIYMPQVAVGSMLPFQAVSVSRRALDEAILLEASACRAEVKRGRAVRSLRRIGERWIAELDGGGAIAAADAFLATGKHDLRGWKRPAGRQNDLVAFKLHWRITPARIAALGSCIELFLFSGGYAGISLVESGILNLCLVIRQGDFAQFDNRWDLLLSALRAEFLPLHHMLTGAEACSNRPLAIASIPYGFVQARSEGPWRLGDQAAVIPSFTGDGIGIALHSARMAVDYYLSGQGCSAFQCDLARDVTRQVQRATLLSRLLVHPKAQVVAMAAAQMAPSLLRKIARGTRIPSRRWANGCHEIGMRGAKVVPGGLAAATPARAVSTRPGPERESSAPTARQ